MSARLVENAWSRVRQWVEEHSDEWEGQDLTGDAPLRVFAGEKPPRRVLVSTKEAAVRRWKRADWPAGLVVVVVVGMVSKAQAALVEALSTSRSMPIPFVGDADTMSLHTYFSLRAHLGAKRVRFEGVCDGALERIGVNPDTLETLPMSKLDRTQLRALAKLGNIDRVLGPRVSAVLAKGRKIEIEALSFRIELVRELFTSAAAAQMRSREARRMTRGQRGRRPNPK